GLLALVGRHRRALERGRAQRAEARGRRREDAMPVVVAHTVQSKPSTAALGRGLLTLATTRCYNPDAFSQSARRRARRPHMRHRLVPAAAVVLALIGLAAVTWGQALSGEYKIGVLEPLTGPLAGEGKRHLEGFEIVRDLINERGGVMGKKLAFAVADAPDPTAAASEANGLITRESVKIVTGTYSSRLCGAASEAAA